MSLYAFTLGIGVAMFLVTLFLVFLASVKLTKKGNLIAALLICLIIGISGACCSLLIQNKLYDMISSEYDYIECNLTYNVLNLSYDKDKTVVLYTETNGDVMNIRTDRIKILNNLPDGIDTPLLEIYRCRRGIFYWDEYTVRVKE